jgi:RimJ/RimL family protein N-acetyltransferase
MSLRVGDNLLSLVDYTEDFLVLSGVWLRDPEIKTLTQTPDFTDEQQLEFFLGLADRSDYLIYGVLYNGERIGAAGLKNISGRSAEYWGYIGVKELWGKKLGQEMVNGILQIAGRRGLENVNLKVSIENMRAIKLYTRLGFDVINSSDGLHCMQIKVGGGQNV